MSEDQKRQLEQQLWAIANILSGKMDVICFAFSIALNVQPKLRQTPFATFD